MNILTSDTKQYKQATLLVLFLLSTIIFWVFSIIFRVILGHDSLIAYGIAVLPTMLVILGVYLKSGIHIATEEAFVIERVFNNWFPKSSFKFAEKRILINEITHVIIEPKPSPIHHSPTMGVKLQKRGRKIIFERFMILRDWQFKSLMVFLDFLKDKNISYYISIGNDYQLKKFLKEKGIPLKG